MNDYELVEALNAVSIAFAYHSCKIENDNITYDDVREIFDHDGVTSYTGDLRTLFEIRNAMNYLLVLNGHPPIVIHQEDRKDYYGALEAWDTGQDLKPMVAFLKEQTVKTWQKQV